MYHNKHSKMIQQLLLQLLLLLQVISMAKAAAAAPSLTKPNCPSSCGNNVKIPFPFGIGEDCYLDESYAVECRSNKPVLRSIDLELLDLSLQASTVQVNQPVFNSCKDETEKVSLLNLETLPFYFSVDNMFYGIGCDNFVVVYSSNDGDDDDYIVGGCLSICHPENKTHVHECGGIQCCLNNIPPALQILKISVNSINSGTRSNSPHQDCKYAFLADKAWIRKNINSTKDVQILKQIPVTLNWRISNSSYGKLTLNKSPTNGSSFECVADESGLMKCICLEGYEGNPYFPRECQDIDECKSGKPDICKSNMVCQNYKGGHRCIAPKNSNVHMVILGIGTGLGGLFLLIGACWLCMKIRKRMKKKERNFKRNGGLLLQEKLKTFGGGADRCKIYNSKELDKATDHFNVNRIIGQGGQGTVYKGMLADGRIIAVKKSKVAANVKIEEFIHEIAILSQINHRNVVKLLGCCLETYVPLLVYEFIPNGTLFEYIHDEHEEIPLTWEIRLRIAIEVAEALSYLHFAASLPIYHRDVKSTNILLDDKYKAKIADFGTSISIAIDQTHITTKVQGTFGYLDPEYFHSSQFTEKSDVYSFGVVLAELLTGEKPINSTWAEEGKNLAIIFVTSMEENHLFDILDARVREVAMGKEEEILAVANVAKNCLNPIGKNRPTIKEVAKELARIRASKKGSNEQQNYEEVEHDRTELIEPGDVASSSTLRSE